MFSEYNVNLSIKLTFSSLKKTPHIHNILINRHQRKELTTLVQSQQLLQLSFQQESYE